MPYILKLQRPTEAQSQTVAGFISLITTADPALLVTPTAGNFVTTEEKSAELNIAVPTAGVAAAVAAAQAAFIASLGVITTALQGNPLGEGVEGLALEGSVRTVLAALALPTDVNVSTTTNLPAGISEGSAAGYGSIEMNLGDFLALMVAALQLVRARAFIATSLAVNGK